MATPVTVYTKPQCIQCDRTKKALTLAGIDFDTIDITEDAAALAFITGELGYSAAPVVVAGDTHWSGYNPERIKTLTAAA